MAKDHREIGQELDLFSTSEKTPGFIYWHPKGALLFDLIVKDIKERLEKFDYQEIKTPAIIATSILKESGHYDNYHEKLFFVGSEKELKEPKWALKPMNCPGSIMIFKSKMRSYKELPLRFSEIGTVYRYEQAGEVGGLFRVRALTIDDAHIYCREEQIEEEIISLINFVNETYQKYGFENIHIELSTRPEKSIGTDEQWQKAEDGLKKALETKNLEYKLNEGEGAFYGPKIDFHVKDSQGRSWQMGTIQLDFSMSERLEAFYIDEKNHKQNPVIIHRAILGSIERFMGVLLEHTGGNLPTWMVPVQAQVIPISEKYIDYAKEIADKVQNSGIRVAVDLSNESVSKKIREAEIQKIPYMLVIGEKEKAAGKVSIRTHKENNLGMKSLEEVVELIKQEPKN